MHIHYFAMVGKIDELKQYLHDNPSLLNAKSKESESSLLIVAVYSAQLEIARFLLSFPNIDIYVKDQNGRNVLHFLFLRIVDAKAEEREAYYDIAKTILQLDARHCIHNSIATPLLETQDRRMCAPLLLISSSRDEEIKRTILDMDKKVKETELKAQKDKLQELEDRKETVRLQLYSEGLPSILRMRQEGENPRWRFSLSSIFGFWAKKPTSLESERENLLERKIKVE